MAVVATGGISLVMTSQDVQELAKSLQKISKRAIPYAVRNTLNAAAFYGRANWSERISKQQTLRNKWTTQNLHVEKATGTSLHSMQSKVGSLLDYQATQESGGTETAKGKHGKAIPTTSASGEAKGAKRRKKLVQKKNWLSAIALAGRGVGGSRKQRNAIVLRLAAKHGGIAYLDTGKRKGLFSVKRSGKRRLTIRMLWNLSKRSVHIKPTHMLEATVQRTVRVAAEFQRQALTEQIDTALMHFGYHGAARRMEPMKKLIARLTSLQT